MGTWRLKHPDLRPVRADELAQTLGMAGLDAVAVDPKRVRVGGGALEVEIETGRWGWLARGDEAVLEGVEQAAAGEVLHAHQSEWLLFP